MPSKISGLGGATCFKLENEGFPVVFPIAHALEIEIEG